MVLGTILGDDTGVTLTNRATRYRRPADAFRRWRQRIHREEIGLRRGSTAAESFVVKTSLQTN